MGYFSITSKRRLLSGRAGPVLVLTLIFLSAFFFGTAIASTNGCMVERFNATKPATVDSLNCTSNDVQLAQYTLISGPSSCIEGEAITVVLRGKFLATSAERWDVGVFVATDGGDPNSLGGTCYNDFLHPVSETNLDLELISGDGPFYNGEITEDPGDLCGDIEQGAPAFFETAEITIICQDSDNNNVADVNSCTVWANSRSDGDNKPSCIDELDTTAETKAKCTCGPVEILGLEVPETGTITVIKDLIPTDDSGKFNLQIDGATAGTGADVGNGGTTGVIEVTAGTNIDPGETHTVGETAGTGTSLADYDSSIYCSDGTDEIGLTSGTGPVDVFVEPDDAWVCTITNTANKAKLTLVKVVLNADGGNAQPDDFLLTVNGVSVLSNVSNEYNVNEALTIDETLVEGYQFVSISGNAKCPTDLDGTITLAPGDDITCTITNDDIAATLTLVKTVVNDNGGKLTQDDFPSFVNGNAQAWDVKTAFSANVQLTASETEQAGRPLHNLQKSCFGYSQS